MNEPMTTNPHNICAPAPCLKSHSKQDGGATPRLRHAAPVPRRGLLPRVPPPRDPRAPPRLGPPRLSLPPRRLRRLPRLLQPPLLRVPPPAPAPGHATRPQRPPPRPRPRTMPRPRLRGLPRAPPRARPLLLHIPRPRRDLPGRRCLLGDAHAHRCRREPARGFRARGGVPPRPCSGPARPERRRIHVRGGGGRGRRAGYLRGDREPGRGVRHCYVGRSLSRRRC
ncbi:hypothetical protein VPH35_060294 [Triticum aestivum]